MKIAIERAQKDTHGEYFSDIDLIRTRYWPYKSDKCN